jgi:hypothetical protein
MISILDINRLIKEKKLSKPVTSSQIFLINSTEFHPQGLMSEEIFGLEGSKERTNSLSYTELNCNIIHPMLYDILTKTIERKIADVASAQKTFDLDENGYLVENVDDSGSIRGLSGLQQNINKIRFRESGSPERSKVIQMIYENIKKNLFFMDKLLIISPTFRNVYIDDKAEKVQITVDDLTKLYQRVISLSSQIKSVSGLLHDIMAYKMQLLVRDVLELIRVRISKKEGTIRNLILGKRVDYSARTVITPNPNLKPKEVGLPFRIAVKVFEPYIIYGLTNSPYAHLISKEFFTEVRKYLGKEGVFEIE